MTPPNPMMGMPPAPNGPMGGPMGPMGGPGAPIGPNPSMTPGGSMFGGVMQGLPPMAAAMPPTGAQQGILQYLKSLLFPASPLLNQAAGGPPPPAAPAPPIDTKFIKNQIESYMKSQKGDKSVKRGVKKGLEVLSQPANNNE